MKSLIFLLGLVTATNTKSWSGDGYVDERDAVCVLGWVDYLRRVILIAFIFSGVVLYYVPASRSYARKLCCALIDHIAEGLKSILVPTDSESMYDSWKTKYKRSLMRFEHSPRLHVNEDIHGIDYERYQKRNKSRVSMNDGKSPSEDCLQETERPKPRSNKDYIKDHQRHHRCFQRRHGSTLKNSRRSRLDLTSKTVRLHPDPEIEMLQKYVRTKFLNDDAKEPDRSFLDHDVNETFLVRNDSPRQSSLVKDKYDRDNIVILHDPRCSSKTRIKANMISKDIHNNYSMQDGPTRDCDNYSSIDADLETRSHKSSASNTPHPGKTYESVEDDQHDFQSNMSDYTRTSNISSYQEESDIGDNICITSRNNYNNTEEFLAKPRRTSEDHEYDNGQKVTEYTTTEYTYKQGFQKNTVTRQKRFQKIDNCLKHQDEPEREHGHFCPHSEHEDDNFPMADHMRPTLKRAIKWLFGSCPGAKQHSNVADIGKEEIRDNIDEWLVMLGEEDIRHQGERTPVDKNDDYFADKLKSSDKTFKH